MVQRLDIEKLIKIPLIYSASYLNLGGLFVAMFEGLITLKPPMATGQLPKLLGGVYFVISGKSTAGGILPLGVTNWLNWSHDKHDSISFG